MKVRFESDDSLPLGNVRMNMNINIKVILILLYKCNFRAI